MLKVGFYGDFQYLEFNQILRKIARFLYLVQVGDQKYRRIF